mgnify:CR=1 FL=1
MKYLVQAVCMVMIVVSCNVRAEDNAARFSSSCDPGDGPALEVTVPMGGTAAKFKAMIWRKGLSSFHAQKAFVLDNSISGSEGNGRAEIVLEKRSPETPPDITQVSARFDPPERGGGNWTVTVHLPDRSGQDLIYFISPVMSGPPQRCKIGLAP